MVQAFGFTRTGKTALTYQALLMIDIMGVLMLIFSWHWTNAVRSCISEQ